VTLCCIHRLDDFIEKFIISKDRALGRSLSDTSIENELSIQRGLSKNVDVDEVEDLDAERSLSDQPSPTRTDAFGYMAQHDIFEQIPELGNDIDIPGICKRTGRGRVQKVNGWMGPCGTISPLHKDRHDNILVQVSASPRPYYDGCENKFTHTGDHRKCDGIAPLLCRLWEKNTCGSTLQTSQRSSTQAKATL